MRKTPSTRRRRPEHGRGLRSGVVLATLLTILTLPGCDGDDGPSSLEYFGDVPAAGGGACLQDEPTNCAVQLQGMTVELKCHGEMSEVAAPTSTGLVWAPQLTLDCSISTATCAHHLVFWIRNPRVGVGQPTGKFIEAVPTYTGVYSGDLSPAEAIRQNSSLEITSVDPTVTGTFSVELEDGAVFSGGHFEVTPTR